MELMNTKRAVVLAGGKGTRLKPYTVTLPKPLVPVGDKPILEIIVLQLKESGFTHITLAVNHMADVIRAFFSDGSKWNIKIDYTFEQTPLSTMGPLTLLADLPENFLVMNGDILTDLEYGMFFEDHVSSGAIFTIASHRRNEMIDYGVLHKGKNSQLVKFEEKPHFEFLISMGIYMANRRILDFIPRDTFFGFDHLMKALLDANRPVRLYEHDGQWLDIGRPTDYEKATIMMADPTIKFV